MDQQPEKPTQPKPRKGKLLNVKQMLQKTFVLIENCSPKILECFGEMQDTFTMIVYGPSGHGKTNMLADFLKGISHVGEILYLSFEEGHGKTIQNLIIRHNLENIDIKFLDTEDFESFFKRMKRKKSPKIVVVDSWQYTRWTFEDYKRLKENFVFGKTPGKRKIFIFISHADGIEPKGADAKNVKYDCNIKVYVKKFIGFVDSRFGSKRNYVIWEESARNYYGKDFDKMVNKIKPERRAKKKTSKKQESKPQEASEKITHLQIAPEAAKPVFKTPLEQLKEVV